MNKKITKNISFKKKHSKLKSVKLKKYNKKIANNFNFENSLYTIYINLKCYIFIII